jgi:hypothetical protein
MQGASARNFYWVSLVHILFYPAGCVKIPEPLKTTRAHMLLHCHTFEDVRREEWNDPKTGAFTRPRSIRALLENPRSYSFL